MTTLTENTKPKIKNPNKLFYTLDNVEGTYEDLANWFTEILKTKNKDSVTKLDIIEFLKTKGRVPPGILKKNKPKVVSQNKNCIAICVASKKTMQK